MRLFLRDKVAVAPATSLNSLLKKNGAALIGRLKFDPMRNNCRIVREATYPDSTELIGI